MDCNIELAESFQKTIANRARDGLGSLRLKALLLLRNAVDKRYFG
jgi:hypothetical protein